MSIALRSASEKVNSRMVAALDLVSPPGSFSRSAGHIEQMHGPRTADRQHLAVRGERHAAGPSVRADDLLRFAPLRKVEQERARLGEVEWVGVVEVQVGLDPRRDRQLPAVPAE